MFWEISSFSCGNLRAALGVDFHFCSGHKAVVVAAAAGGGKSFFLAVQVIASAFRKLPVETTHKVFCDAKEEWHCCNSRFGKCKVNSESQTQMCPESFRFSSVQVQVQNRANFT